MSEAEVIKVHRLKEPVEIHNKDGEIIDTITELRFRKPRGAHFKAMDKVQGEVAKSFVLAAAMCGVPPSTMDRLSGEDVLDVLEIVDGFFGGRLKTGATSSET